MGLQPKIQDFAQPQPSLRRVVNMHTMQETTIMTTRPNGEQKPRKMRASCDACSRAKVLLKGCLQLAMPTNVFVRSNVIK